MSAIVSIILVDFKTSELSRKRAASLSVNPQYEVIIVDNNIKNRGYGAGINYGVGRSSGEYLLFLNPDVEITPHDIETLLAYIREHADVGAVGPQFVDTKGSIVPSSLGKLSLGGAFIGLSFLHRLLPHNAISSPFWMPNWKRDTQRSVATINGACMLVRRTDFEAIGGFDESFFLYWEENDLCDRLRQKGKRIVFYPMVCVTHTREVSMRQSTQDVDHIFKRSRNVYLYKTFGWKALFLHAWVWACESWRSIGLFFLTLMVRLYNLGGLVLIPDVERDYTQAKLMLAGRAFPLLGIPSSVPRFSQGPLNVWFDALSFFIGGQNMYAPVIAASLLTAVTAVIFFGVFKRFVGRNVALLSSLIFVLSPAAISQARMPFYLFAIPLFVLLYLWSLVRIKKSVFVAVLTFCLLFQWELATIPLVVLLLIAIYKNRLRVAHIWRPVRLGFLIGLLPQIVFDLTHRCQQLCMFVVWMGYRTVAVSGVDGRHGFVLFSLSFWQRVGEQFGWLFGAQSVFLGVVAVIVIAFVRRRKKLLAEPLYLYNALGVVFLLIGLVIHGNPSEAYFPPFLVLFSILVGYSLKDHL